MIVNYKLSRSIPGVFLLQIKDPHDLAMTFWRAQEFYESSNTLFKGGKFTFAEYAIWYGKVFTAENEKPSMSYAADWIGFNVPSYILEKTYQVHDERMAYDQLMLQAMAACKFLTGEDRYYLIGTSYEDPHGALDHELAHGMYTVNKAYRVEMNKLVAEMPADLREKTLTALHQMGYNSDVCVDELQANMATGICRALANLHELKGLRGCTAHFEDCFKRHLPPINTQLLCETTFSL